ncbi:hypothetical protein [Salipiger sp. PrR003]|uniref:hypothetical protein n=1 Tax=Salipiger sp. PrR003 TaxID=2706776 RepID=UPI0013DAC700|nr:hypothetical protein [Salipiger sp. PrR003]NDV53937.1 hypothetical protein [Salipiger sp. PrR003]
MSTLETDLKQLGVDLASREEDVFPAFGVHAAQAQTFLAFSAYGEFTPIKVGSGTRIANADLERNKR